MLQQKRMRDVEWEWLNVISMTQLSGASIWKDSMQFNNDITLAHARTRALTHTHNADSCHGVKHLQMQIGQGLLTYRFKWTIGGGWGNSYRLDGLLKYVYNLRWKSGQIFIMVCGS